MLSVGPRQARGAEDPLSQWQVVQGVKLGGGEQATRRLAYGGGVFVAFYEVPMLYSTDGTSWNLGSDFGWPTSDMVYGDGQFLGVIGAMGILRSSDGRDWSLIPTMHRLGLLGIGYGRGRYAAVTGDTSLVARSGDIYNWTETKLSSPLPYIPYAIVFGRNRLLMLLRFRAIVSSADGIDWTTNYTWVSAYLSAVRGVARGQGKFVAVGWPLAATNSASSIVSADGIDWERHITPGVAPYFWAVAYGNGTFVAVGEVTTGGNGLIATSTDGINWKPRYSGTTERPTGVVFGNGRFLVAGEKGTVIRSALLAPHVSTPRFRVSDCFRLRDGAMLLTVDAPYGRAVTVEASADLRSWQTIATDPCDRGEFEVYDEDAKSLKQRFYRAKQQAP